MNTQRDSTRNDTDYDLLPDDTLAIAAKGGDHHARNTLYLRHRHAIKGMVARPARIVARRSQSDSSIEPQDVVQQTFLIFCDLLDRWPGAVDPAQEPFLPYLSRLLPSQAAHFVRDKLHYRATAYQSRLHPTLALQPYHPPHHPLDESPQPVTSFQEQTSCLNPHAKRLINLRYTLSLSTPQIAALTGLTPRTVDRHLQAALAQLRLHLSAPFGSVDC